MIQIKLVTDPQEREKIYRFRYGIYVEEMSRLQHYADHKKRMICEPLDENGRLFVAYKDDEIIGTVRSNYSRDSDIGYYSDFYEMHQLGKFHSQRTSITTKLMIKPEYRKSTLAVRLCNAAYKCALNNRIRYDFIDVNSHLIEFFRGLGHRVYKNANHPEYGDVTIMILDMEDINHLEVIKSPFRREYYLFFNVQQSSIA